MAKDCDPGYTAGYKDKQAAQRKLTANAAALCTYQDMFYAQVQNGIIPADKKWFTRLAVSEIILSRLNTLQHAYPVVSRERREELREIAAMLKREG